MSELSWDVRNVVQVKKRRGRDSNPWTSFWPVTSLAKTRIRPLCHLSLYENSVLSSSSRRECSSESFWGTSRLLARRYWRGRMEMPGFTICRHYMNHLLVCAISLFGSQAVFEKIVSSYFSMNIDIHFVFTNFLSTLKCVLWDETDLWYQEILWLAPIRPWLAHLKLLISNFICFTTFAIKFQHEIVKYPTKDPHSLCLNNLIPSFISHGGVVTNYVCVIVQHLQHIP